MGRHIKIKWSEEEIKLQLVDKIIDLSNELDLALSEFKREIDDKVYEEIHKQRVLTSICLAKYGIDEYLKFYKKYRRYK